MKTDSIQSVILAGLNDFFPRRDIHRRITRERKIAAEMSQAQVDRPTVDENVLVVRGDFAEAKINYSEIIERIAF